MRRLGGLLLACCVACASASAGDATVKGGKHKGHGKPAKLASENALSAGVAVAAAAAAAMCTRQR